MAGPVEVTSKKIKPAEIYRASKLRLYGVRLRTAECTVGSEGQVVGIGCSVSPKPGDWIPALIYGYAYQGHVYSLPEPVIMIVDKNTEYDADDSGYSDGYKMWEADKLDRTARLELANDTFEELILKKNLGDSRQPVSYHAAMTISHRGGKLIE